MARLRDGRFLLLREASRGWSGNQGHEALAFDGDPLSAARARSFVLGGIPNFNPTDMAQLPDGRVLVLMRRLVWPLPARFAGRIAIGDPREIREGKIWRVTEVAKLTSTLPVDNFEGITTEARPDGRVAVWLISDDNGSAFQRTLLWRLSVDPDALPGKRAPAEE